MEFLVTFQLDIPDSASDSEVEDRSREEADAAVTLADQGHLVRLWKAPAGDGPTTILGLYRAESGAELEALLVALPMYEWMDTSITPLRPHPNDPLEPSGSLNSQSRRPAPRRRMDSNRRA
jgi:muconolactone D-isomerase